MTNKMSRNIVKELFQKDVGNKYCRDYDFLYSRLRSFTAREEEAPIFTCKLSRCPGYEHVLAVAGEDGKVYLMTSNEDLEDYDYVFIGHLNAIFDISWMNGETKFVTASGDQSVVLWDFDGTRVALVSRFTSHLHSVKVAAFAPECKNVFATGCRGGEIKIWDVRRNAESGEAATTITGGHRMRSNVSYYTKKKSCKKVKRSISSITGLDFKDPNTIITCAAGDGIIKFWDIRKPYEAYSSFPHALSVIPYRGMGQEGYSYLQLDHTKQRLFVNGVDGTIYSYNLASTSVDPVCRFVGHTNHSNYIKSCLSPDGRYLMSGSSDGYGYIWRAKESVTQRTLYPIVKMIGHSRELTCMAWRKVGDPRIYTFGDDGKHYIWKFEHSGCYRSPVGCTEVVIPPPRYAIRAPTPYPRELPIEDSIPEVAIGGINGTPSVTAPCAATNNSSKRPLSSVVSSGEPDSSERVKRSCQESSWSITANLPNYVIDGTTPHIPFRRLTPTKESKDWLTQLRETTPKSSTSGNSQKSSPKSYYTRSKAKQNASPDITKYFQVLQNRKGTKQNKCVPEEESPDYQSESSESD